jgi:hypothetical protein
MIDDNGPGASARRFKDVDLVSRRNLMRTAVTKTIAALVISAIGAMPAFASAATTRSETKNRHHVVPAKSSESSSHKKTAARHGKHEVVREHKTAK